MQRLCGFGCVGLAMSKGGERASMVALTQPTANGSLCGGGWRAALVNQNNPNGKGCSGYVVSSCTYSEVCRQFWLTPILSVI